MCREWRGTPFGHKEGQRGAIGKTNPIHEAAGLAASVVVLGEHLTPLGHCVA
jgi:hypothetical protein